MSNLPPVHTPDDFSGRLIERLLRDIDELPQAVAKLSETVARQDERIKSLESWRSALVALCATLTAGMVLLGVKLLLTGSP